MTIEETLTGGTLTEAAWLPGQSTPALEIRRDCPGEGEWLVVQRWPDPMPLTWIFAGPVAERRAWRRYYLCEADIARARADACMTDDEEKAMAEKQPPYYKPCGATGCPAQGRAPAPDIDPVRHRGYADIEQWRGALAEYAQEAQLNLGRDWRDTTAALWDNGRHCTCQVGAVACPCPQGIALAKAGGECHCGLFVGHNID